MAKFTRLPPPGPDDPIFSQPPIISVPVSRPSTESSPQDDPMAAAVSAMEEALKRKRASYRDTEPPEKTPSK